MGSLRVETSRHTVECKVSDGRTQPSNPSKKDPVVIFEPRTFRVPRRVLVNSFQFLDSQDSPDMPGLCHETSLLGMVDRFDRQVHNASTSQAQVERARQIEEVVSHLRRHTRRRRGELAVREGFLEWEQTARIYELFSVDLNMFERVFLTFDISESPAILSKVMTTFLVLMIFASIMVWMLSTMPEVMEIKCTSAAVGECPPEPPRFFTAIEQICVYVFTVEYIVKLFTVHSVRFELFSDDFMEALLCGSVEAAVHSKVLSFVSGRSSKGLLGRGKDGACEDGACNKVVRALKFLLSPAGVIDLLAIMPYWIQVFQSSPDRGGALIVLRILRLTRIFRVFKMGKYNEVFQLFSRVMAESMPALFLMTFFVLLGCCVFGTLLWQVEQGRWYPEGHETLLDLEISGRGAFLRHDGSLDPDSLAETDFPSIPSAFWYVIVTISTVGYGDASPTTAVGKVVGSFTIFLGVIVLAMPIGVVGANFSSEYHRVLDEKRLQQRLREQMAALVAVEAREDAALMREEQDFASNMVKAPEESTELFRIDNARQRILMEAEAIEGRWQELARMVPMLTGQISNHLQRFTHNLVTGVGSSGASASGPRGKPVISLGFLDDLDILTQRVNAAVAVATSVEKVAPFGLREAHACRKQWSKFAELCWDYAVELCVVEAPERPPEHWEMRARLVRLAVADREAKLATRGRADVAVIALDDDGGAEDSMPGVVPIAASRVAGGNRIG